MRPRDNRRGAVVLALLISAVDGLALAQQGEPAIRELERVEITGSNVRSADSESSENIQIITAEEMARSGQPTVADYLRTVPASFAAYNETFTNSFSPGAAGIALRGLSQKHTLVLLDGRRVANYGFAQNLEDTYVDLNAIPLAAVARIEVLKSGASAIYGSDATAGVVNIILKRDSVEHIADAGITATSGGGGGTRDASLAYGIGGPLELYNIYLTGSLYKRDNLSAAQRKFTASQDFSDKPGGFLVRTQANGYLSDANPGAPQSAFPTCGTNGVPGQVYNLSQLPAIGGTGTTCAYNSANQLSLIPGSERANLTATGDFKLGANWKLFGELLYSNVKTASLSQPALLGPTSVAYNPATGGVNAVSNTLSVGNPSNPSPAPQDIAYRFQSVGGQRYTIVSDYYILNAGIKGSWLQWAWETDFGHSENHVRQSTYNSVNVFALGNAITTGNYDFLAPTPTQDALLRVDWTDRSVSRLDTLGVKSSGMLADLPAGPLVAAFGMEFRHESLIETPSSALQAGEILNYGLTQVDGRRSVYAAFSEFDVPLVKGLDADLAIREEHYSDLGNNFSPQLSLRWQPARFATLRGAASRGFRAPSLPEISNASATSFQFVTDPSDPLARPSEPIAVVTKANPNLRAETSDNVDLGIVLSPSRDSSLSIDFYHIQVNHVVAAEATPQAIVNDPAAFPGQVSRTAGGLLNFVVVPYANKYQIATTGLDVDIESAIRLPGGSRFRVELIGTYVSAFKVNNGVDWTDYVGTNGWLWDSPISGGAAVPRWRATLSGTWSDASWLGQLTAHYIGGYSNYCFVYGICPTGAAEVDPNTTFDLHVEFNGMKNWRFSASILNLLNTTPPWDWFDFVVFNGPYDPTLYDARGRTFELRAQYRF